MNWHVYWISAAATALVLAVVMAWNAGQNPEWKESESSTDMLLTLVACSIAGALWPLTGVWFLLTAINDVARKRRKRKLVEEWKRKFAEGGAQFIPLVEDKPCPHTRARDARTEEQR